MKRWTAIASTLVFASIAVWSLAPMGVTQVRTQGGPPVIQDRVIILEEYLRHTMERVDKLENTVKLQEKTIDTLNKTVGEHTTTIKKMEDRLAKTEGAVKKLQDGS
ncbi:MAG: SlyX family protein [Fimbriimonadaceae bacterium]|nr:SlyX family protein [Fimbriimonadaceae bacterium]